MHIFTIGLLLPYKVQYICPVCFLNIKDSIWSSGVKPRECAYRDLSINELCSPANSLSCDEVVLCILCTVMINFSNVLAL